MLTAVFVLLAPAANAQMEKMDMALPQRHFWYEQLWVWVVAACLFLLLLVLLLKRGEKN